MASWFAGGMIRRTITLIRLTHSERAQRLRRSTGLGVFCCTHGFFSSKTEFREGVQRLAKVCQVTGKRAISGHNVSHANNKTKRRFLPNLHDRRLWVESERRWVRLRVSSKGLRIIDKKGIDAVLAEMRARGVKI